MPDPNDPPDPGPIDDLQRETERILRAVADRSNARAAQRDLADRNSQQLIRNDQQLVRNGQQLVRNDPGQQQTRDERARAEQQRATAERRRADLVADRAGTVLADSDRSDRVAARAGQREGSADPEVRRRAVAEGDRYREDGLTQRVAAERGFDRAAQHETKAERHESTADRGRAATGKAAGPGRTAGGRQERLAERLAANGIGGQLAQTRIRAERSQAAPASAIRSRAAAGRSASGSAERGAQRSGAGHAADHRNRRERPGAGRGRTR